MQPTSTKYTIFEAFKILKFILPMNTTEKICVELEYILSASPQMIYNYVATPGGLSKWFADNVILRGDKYVFVWDDAEECAKLISKTKNKQIKFQWDSCEGTSLYFKFDISKDGMTNKTVLKVCDVADPDEEDEIIDLWNCQIDELKHCIGC